ncbi:MAG: biosynthetic peptidoglycan transglycosylase [Verrucomicrobiota bacterium]
MHQATKPDVKSRRRRVVRWLLVILILLALTPPVQVLYVRSKDPTTTTVIWQRSLQHSDWPREQEWTPLQDVPADLIWFAVLSEDGRFFEHDGVDWIEMNKAMEVSGTRGRGASTITMQTARSLFLWQGRSYIRKVLELYYTWWMELLLTKERILELYLNVLETGPGVYGMAAGSQYQFDKPLNQLNRSQLALLVAILPNPIQRAAHSPSPSVTAKQRWILKYSKQWQKPEELSH